MIIVNYTKNGIAVSDEKSEKMVKLLDDGDVIEVSTENVILAVRTLVSEGYFKQKDIKVQQDGVDCEWTKKCDLKNFKGTMYDDYLDRMLGIK